MRYGVIADIHGNLPALHTALVQLEKDGVDAVVCLGDLVGYGPWPNEVIETVAERDIPCVLGNHDAVVATNDGFDRVGELARASLRWTAERVTDAARRYLAELPVTKEVDDVLLLAHGSRSDPWTYVRRTDDALSELDRLEERYSVALLLGHTHRQFVVARARALATSEWLIARRRRTVDLALKAVVNPGSVGQPREPRDRCRFAMLDLDARLVHLYAIAYPSAETRATLLRAGLPEHACHVRPTLKKAVRQAVRDYEDRKTR